MPPVDPVVPLTVSFLTFGLLVGWACGCAYTDRATRREVEAADDARDLAESETAVFASLLSDALERERAGRYGPWEWLQYQRTAAAAARN